MKAKKLIMKLIDKHLEFVPLRGLAAADAAAAGRGRGAELAAVPGPLPLLPPPAGQDGLPLRCQVCTAKLLHQSSHPPHQIRTGREGHKINKK